MRRGDLPLAAQLLLEPLNATAEPAMFAPEQYLGGWYGNAVSLLLAANRQPAALQLLNRQLDRGIGSEAELAFAAGVRCYLEGDRAASSEKRCHSAGEPWGSGSRAQCTAGYESHGSGGSHCQGSDDCEADRQGKGASGRGMQSAAFHAGKESEGIDFIKGKGEKL